MKIFDSFKKMEMSKKLTVFILIFWVLAVITDIVVYLITGKDINVAVDYVNTAFLIGYGSYFGKSALENIQKIKSSNAETTANNAINNGNTEAQG